MGRKDFTALDHDAAFGEIFEGAVYELSKDLVVRDVELLAQFGKRVIAAMDFLGFAIVGNGDVWPGMRFIGGVLVIVFHSTLQAN